MGGGLLREMGTQSIISILAWDVKRSTQSESDMVFSLLSLFHILSIFLLRISFLTKKGAMRYLKQLFLFYRLRLRKSGDPH
jgi:hypothetical protein